MTLKNRKNDSNLYFLVLPGTNVRYSENGSIAAVDGEHADAFVRHVNRVHNANYEKVLISKYHQKFAIAKLLGTKLRLEDLKFLVRRNTSERHVNHSGDINVCTQEHVERILPNLNKYGNTWIAMPVLDYYQTYGLIV